MLLADRKFSNYSREINTTIQTISQDTKAKIHPFLKEGAVLCIHSYLQLLWLPVTFSSLLSQLQGSRTFPGILHIFLYVAILSGVYHTLPPKMPEPNPLPPD